MNRRSKRFKECQRELGRWNRTVEKRGGDEGGRRTKDQEKREGQRSLKKGRDSR